MTNREKLLHTNLYDLLCRMQKELDDRLVVELNFCVLDLLGVDTDAVCDGEGYCERCLQAWLNSKYDGRW